MTGVQKRCWMTGVQKLLLNDRCTEALLDDRCAAALLDDRCIEALLDDRRTEALLDDRLPGKTEMHVLSTIHFLIKENIYSELALLIFIAGSVKGSTINAV